MCATSPILARGSDSAEVGSWDLWVRGVGWGWGVCEVGGGGAGWGRGGAGEEWGGTGVVRGRNGAGRGWCGGGVGRGRTRSGAGRGGAGLSGSSPLRVPLVRRSSPPRVLPSGRPVLRRAVPVRPIFMAAGRGGTRPAGSAAATGTPSRAATVTSATSCTRAWPIASVSRIGRTSFLTFHARVAARSRGPVFLRPLPRGDRAHRLRLPWTRLRGLPPPPPPHAPPRCGPRRFRPPLAPPRRRLPPPPARARRRDRDLRRGDRDSDCQWGVAGSGSWQRQHRRRPTRPPGTPPAETVHG